MKTDRTEVFGCCAKYEDCSALGVCIKRNDPEYAKCSYRKHLETGNGFYAKSKDKDTLSIDIETYSSVDIKKCGVYAYTEARDFEILLFAYCFNDGEVKIIDVKRGEPLPRDVKEALWDEDVIKTAYNAAFERVCIPAYFWKQTGAPFNWQSQWRCTQVRTLALGLPLRLGDAARVIGLPEGLRKMGAIGDPLIKFFSVPCKPKKSNDFRTRNLPQHDTEKWEQFKVYCKQDVVVERAVAKIIEKYPLPDGEQKLWELDQRINDRGIKADEYMINCAIDLNRINTEKLTNEAVNLSGIENPNSVAQIKDWLLTEEGEEVESINKETLPELLKKLQGTDAERLLQIRSELGKTSIKKYQAMINSMCYDKRIRGLVMFYGANRTGRWAGRIVQVQNLPKNFFKELGSIRNLLKKRDFESLSMLYPSVSSVLSQLIRTAFIPDDGCKFLVADFSAIEARVIAWLAGEQWRMGVFATHGKIYEASASQMFNISIDQITKELRQKGKVAELALGYQGSTGALIKMGALKQGLKPEELPEIVEKWRQASPSITDLWSRMNSAALKTVRNRCKTAVNEFVSFDWGKNILFMDLPSGRRLAYVKPQIEKNRWDRDCISYEGMDQEKKIWTRLQTYGGKLTENCVQAIARDCLAVSMLKLEQKGFSIVAHVHDEVILEVPGISNSLKEVCKIMSEPVSWAQGLVLGAAGFETPFYRKDD